MQDFVLGLDLDRVIFDTNSYFQCIDSRLEPHGTSMREIFSRNGNRKDLGVLFEALVRMVGKKEADRVLFEGVREFVHPEMKVLADLVISRGGRVVVVSVGDGLQTRKLEGFPYSEIFPVVNDDEKVRAVRSLGLPLFVDDKRKIVERLRAGGTRAYQAVWFLDNKHRKGALVDSLSGPSQLREIVEAML